MGGVFLVAGVIAAQLLYPLDRAMPFASLQHTQVGWRTETELVYEVTSQFEAATLRLQAGEEVIETPLASTGATVDAAQVVQTLTQYPFWQRFIPFSILFQRPSADTIPLTYTNQVLAAFATQTSEALQVAPKNARVSLENGVVVAVDDTPGVTVTAEAIMTQIRAVNWDFQEVTTVPLMAHTVAAETTAQDLAAVRNEVETALQREVVVTADSTTVTATRAQVASWLVLGQSKEKKVELTFDRAALQAFLEKNVNAKVGVTPNKTIIYLVDGKEEKRTQAKPGRHIDYGPLIDEIQQWVMRAEGTGTFEARFVAIPPTAVYERRYTSSQTGLRAYVRDAGRMNNAAIVVKQLGGNLWSAEYNAWYSMPSASTYKLYVAWMLFHKMDQGDIAWNDAMRDTTVSGCFDRMTIASTNPCAEQWLSEFGRTNLNNFVYARGISKGTSFTNPIASHTTAGDLANVMTRIETGTIFKSEQKARLLRSLSTHPYRKGVPAGSNGAVYDKVGFLWNYTHDAAIVRHPRGTYVIVVMTKGQSYEKIAEITRRVETILYP